MTVAIPTHRVILNIDLRRRQRIEIIRTYLTLHHPDTSCATYTDAVHYLIDVASVDEMVKVISEAKHIIGDQFNERSENPANDGLSAGGVAAPVADEPRRKRGRPAKRKDGPGVAPE